MHYRRHLINLEEMVVPGATGEFYPYVSTDIVTEPVIAS